MMDTEVKQIWSVSHAGSLPWLVADESHVEQDNVSYLKLNPRTRGFINLICHKGHKVKVIKNFSLSGSLGLRNLLQFRNEATAEEPEQPKHGVFDADPEDAGKKKHVSMRRIADLRDNHEVIEFTVPATGDTPATTVKAFKPAHPNDILCVQLDGHTLHAIFGYMKAMGVDDITARSYNSGWRHDDGGDEDKKKPKSRSQKTVKVGKKTKVQK
jgi:hypothetical protein